MLPEIELPRRCRTATWIREIRRASKFIPIGLPRSNLIPGHTVPTARRLLAGPHNASIPDGVKLNIKMSRQSASILQP